MSDSKKNRMYNSKPKESSTKIGENYSPTVRGKGVVSSITMGGTTFDVLNPNVMQEIQKTFDAQQNEIARLSDKVSNHKQTINSLVNEVNKLSNEVRRLNDTFRQNQL